jgi:hypothetical protein
MGTVSAVCRETFWKNFYGRDVPAREMSALWEFGGRHRIGQKQKRENTSFFSSLTQVFR